MACRNWVTSVTAIATISLDLRSGGLMSPLALTSTRLNTMCGEPRLLLCQ